MTQKEIKEKMTQGQWVINGGTYDKQINSNSVQCWHKGSNGKEHSTEHNMEAIVSAINNTYTKNINPESVPEMYNALRMLRGYLSEKADKEVIDNITEIIKNATL